MKIATNELVLEAIQSALAAAKRQTEKNRPIENIDAQALCSRFFTEKEEHYSQSTNSNIYWLSAIIETNDDLDDSLELHAISSRLKDGFTAGFDRCESGKYSFDVYGRDCSRD